jgi:CDP-L-myo-inositol myo-inositolphosphotransferase
MSTPPGPFEYRKSLKDVRSYPFLHRYLPVDRFFVRPVATLVVRAVFRTPITPNQLTAASFLLSLAAAAFYVVGTRACIVVGGCLAMLSCVFDNADGMLARAKDISSRYGAFLDLFLDRISDFVVLTGLTFGLYRTGSDPRILALGLLTIGLYFLQVSLYYLNQIYTGAGKTGEGAEAKNLAVTAIFIFSLVGLPIGILIGVFTMAAVGTVVKLITFLRKAKVPEAAPAP